MKLQWFRVDNDIARHDKILWLKTQRGGWQAITVYLFALGWSVGQQTDGHIPTHVAPSLDATKAVIGLLVAAGMWEPVPGGWQIRNFDERQALSEHTEKRAAAGAKGNCVRWHGPHCGCWKRAEAPTP